MGLHDFAASDNWLDQFKKSDAEHNIDADKWAEAPNPQPHPTSTTPPNTHPHSNLCTIRNARFLRFYLEHDGLMDQQTNKRMDKASYKFVSSQLKKGNLYFKACLFDLKYQSGDAALRLFIGLFIPFMIHS